MIGCGGIAGRHVRDTLAIPEASIDALMDVDTARMSAMKEKFPQLKDVPEFTDYDKVLNEIPLDGVMIATPHTGHYEQAMKAFEHNLHVLLEKPMVCSVVHAKSLIAKAEEKKRIVVLAYQRHYQPQYRYIKQMVDSGELGEITFVAALQCQNWKVATTGTWRQKPELSGGGQLNDSGSHLVDMILWITSLHAKSVSAYIDNCGTPVDINSAVSIAFENGAQGTISVVGEAPCWYEDFTIWGKNGVIFYRNGAMQFCKNGGKMEEPTELPEGSDPNRNFVDAILGKDKVWAPAICGLRVIELTEAAWTAGRTCAPCAVASL